MDVEIVIVSAGGPLNFDRNGLAGVIAGCHVEDKGIAIDAFNRCCFIGASCADGGAIPFDRRGRARIDCAVSRIGCMRDCDAEERGRAGSRENAKRIKGKSEWSHRLMCGLSGLMFKTIRISGLNWPDFMGVFWLGEKNRP